MYARVRVVAVLGLACALSLPLTAGCGSQALNAFGDTLSSTILGPKPEDYQLVASATGDPGKWQFTVKRAHPNATDPTTFEWDFGDGQTYTGDYQTYTFTDFGTHVITITGLDSSGRPAFVLTLEIDVPPYNRPPVADAGTEQTVLENETVFLDGSGSTDLDGDQLTFNWMQVAGPPVFLSDSNTPFPQFVAPLVDADDQLVFGLTVSDGLNNSQATVTVNDQDVPEPDPAIAAGCKFTRVSDAGDALASELNGVRPLTGTWDVTTLDGQALQSGTLEWRRNGVPEEVPVGADNGRTFSFTTAGVHTLSLALLVSGVSVGCQSAVTQTEEEKITVWPMIAGKVQDDTGQPLNGVAVSAGNGGTTDVTDANGDFAVHVPYDWSGTVTAQNLDYNFDPNDVQYANVQVDQASATIVGVERTASASIPCTADSGCNDSNPCTDDTCGADGYCHFTVDDTNTCDDGLFCDGAEKCTNGACISFNIPCGHGEICDEETQQCSTTSGNVYYVDDDGASQPGYDPTAAAGTINNPFKTIQAAANVVAAGDTVLIKAGTYRASGTSFWTPVLQVVQGGAPGEPVRFQNYNDDIVVLDGEAVLSTTDNGRRRGIYIPAGSDYVEIRGLVVQNAFREGILIEADHVTVESCIVQRCGLNTTNAFSTGIQIHAGTSFIVRNCIVRNCYAGIGSWTGASDGLIENSVVHHNGLLADGTPIYPENADGITTGAAREGSDRVRVVRCIAFGNTDDQIDLSHSRDCSAEGCIAFAGNSAGVQNGDGNGFKVGNDQNELVGSGSECRRLLIRNCIAYGNEANGIDPRDGIEAVFYNNTAYGNLGQFGFSSGAVGHPTVLFNNISWGNVQSDLFKGDTYKIADYNNWMDAFGNQVPGGDTHSIFADPGFASAADAVDTSWQGGFSPNDVRGIAVTFEAIRSHVLQNFALTNLDAASTSVDRGRFATYTSAAATGSLVIPVTDNPSVRFRVGDVIQLVGGATARVVALSSTTITVDTPVSFASGAGVHVPWLGAAPDLGAVESR